MTTSFIFLNAALLTGAFLFPVRWILRRAGVVDRPNHRSSHSVPTVRGGGVAIVVVLAAVLGTLAFRPFPEGRGSAPVAAVAGSAFAHVQIPALVLFVGFVALAIVSFIDDLKGLPARVRFAVHLASAVAAVLALIMNNSAPITLTAIIVAAIAVTWAAGYTNAFNFMDGINGIAGMQALVTGLGTAAIAVAAGVPATHPLVVLALATAGAALGFLPHNFPRARVFMGDVSSAPLGYLLAVLAFWTACATSWWLLVWVALLHANFVLDTGITLLRRARRGDRLSDAHREHFYQRLVRAGQSHVRVTLTEGALQSLVALALWQTTNAGPLVRLGVAASVVAAWCGYFWYAETVFNASAAGRAVRVDAVKA